MILEKNLEFGDFGDNVMILQEKLKILGFYNPTITGNFGLATLEGVKAFQNEFGLEDTGVVDNETWNLLFDLTEPTVFSNSNYPTLSLNSTGEYVKELQRKLRILLYYTGEVTGTFDNETKTAVKRFQFHNDLTTTGIVDNTTWNYINDLYGNLNSCVVGSEETGDSYYTVLPGDTLYSIARKFNTTVDEIKRLNNLTSNTININQQLLIPGLTNEEKPDQGQDENDNTYYLVKAGDTLYSIARRFNTTVDEIKKLNNLTTNTIDINQKLLIKLGNSNLENILYYPVVSGDTLYSIARRFNTTVDTIISLNNLKSNVLTIGQILKIPSTSNYTYYTVVAGDTLYSIARKFNTTVDTIKSVNNLTSNTLSIGKTLRIPV